MTFSKRQFFSWLSAFFFFLVFAFSVYWKYPLFVDRFYEEAGWLKAHLSKKHLSTSNYRFCYVEKGRGETLLLVHGFRSDKRYWKNYIRKLGEGYHYVALDLPGHGETLAKGAVHFDLLSIADALNEFMEAKKIDSCVLIGTSLGAGFVMEYAFRHPDKIKKVILINPVALRPKTEPALREMVEKNKQRFSPRTVLQLDELLLCLNGALPAYPAAVKNYLLKKTKAGNKQAQKMLEEAATSSGAESYLAHLKMPVLILQGDRDQIVNLQERAVYERKLSCLSYKMIAGGYHIFSSQSLKAAAAEIKNFLNE
ncbi:MAG: alpha/beta hydrolase [Parachlamydiales bacterium]|jgi:pimeloyl-ACP methyl ester carboxylesterase